MKVLNIHTRKFGTPVQNVLDLFATLSTANDKIWPSENWPPIRFNNKLNVGSHGGHGPIRYTIVDFAPESHIEFRFQRPRGFDGTHKFQITPLDSETTEIKHTIKMTTSGMGTISWLCAIKWLHNALIEDAFDKVENQLTQSNLRTKWSLWVKLWRWILASRI